MKTNSNTADNSLYNEFGKLGKVFKWLDEHPKFDLLFFWVNILALIYAVLTYNFTTAL